MRREVRRRQFVLSLRLLECVERGLRRIEAVGRVGHELTAARHRVEGALYVCRSAEGHRIGHLHTGAHAAEYNAATQQDYHRRCAPQ